MYRLILEFLVLIALLGGVAYWHYNYVNVQVFDGYIFSPNNNDTFTPGQRYNVGVIQDHQGPLTGSVPLDVIVNSPDKKRIFLGSVHDGSDRWVFYTHYDWVHRWYTIFRADGYIVDTFGLI